MKLNKKNDTLQSVAELNKVLGNHNLLDNIRLTDTSDLKLMFIQNHKNTRIL